MYTWTSIYQCYIIFVTNLPLWKTTVQRPRSCYEAPSFSWSNQEKTYIHLSKFFISSQSTFLNYIFHKLLSNKEILVALWLLLYKICKNNNEMWVELSSFKKFWFEASKLFLGHSRSPRISRFWLMHWDSLSSEAMFYLQFFSCSFFLCSGE